MPIDRFYEKQTVAGQLKQKAIEAWPTVYRLVNGLVELLFNAFGSMIRSAVNAILGKT